MIRLLALALNIIAIWDVLGSKERSLGEKLVLVVMIVGLPIIGALIYLLVFKEKRS